MTLLIKNYFIVVDRNQEHKKELLFNVNFFYLKSIKKNQQISYVKEPFFKGTVVFGLDFDNKMRPLKFTKVQNENNVTPVNPDLFKKFVLANENQFVAFSNQTNIKELNPIIEMLNNFQFDKNKIKELSFCKLCLDKGQFNLLNNNIQIKSYKKDIICSDCALDIIIKEAQTRNIISLDQRISPKLKNFFNHLVLKFKDINKVISSFKPDFNPIINKEITLYDIEKSPSISSKYNNFNVKDLEIPKPLMMVLENQKITNLLPIQAISIERGLLSNYNDQLIMAPTSGGKTLIGEIAGVSKILKFRANNKNAKVLYLVPIVALANIRTEEFKEKYKSLNLKIIKRVGESLLEESKRDNLEDLNNADIVVATYEAIDYVLRNGERKRLGDTGTIIIDEIQTLIDPERGFLLDGFIARLKSIYKNTQFLYLSATVGEPDSLAKKLNATLVRYNNRPVPIERHLILTMNENIKQHHIAKLVSSAFSEKSIYNFRGQSIIFTNTRKKCETITSYLQNRGIKVKAYHSGLTKDERILVESEFQNQKIAGVVATAALAAGVDLPARQVIFESLAMGRNWLTVAEFEQMLGRAGRLKKHELGFVYILVEPGKIYTPKMKETEENIAIKLLNGKIKDFELEPDDDKSITEVLAFISTFTEGVKKEEIYKYFDLLINQNYDIDKLLKKLNESNFLKVSENIVYKSTKLGRAISKSFLTINESLEILNYIKSEKVASILDLAL
ncbi:MAG TPA: DEAD/DEAH box helicase, partial [Candidatus Lokiarchaeia archaeon]